VIIEPEHEQAEFYYTQGKKVRFPRAICLLGNFYLNHQEYKQKIKGDNARKAIKYFELSRDLGYQKAYYHLAFCYENGLGVNFPNREKAKSYYKEGALRGDTQCKINYMYYVMQDVSNSGRSEEYKFAYNYFRDILISDP
jgi:TPR repeat protein